MLIRISRAFLLILICIVLASLFGIIHNLVTYRLSPDFYFEILFPKFDMDVHGDEKFFAALAGIIGSWWFGLIIGSVLAILFFDIDEQRIRKKLIRNSLLIILFFAVFAALIGSCIGPVVYEYPSPYCEKDPAMDCISLNRANAAHTGTYVGAATGLILVIMKVLSERIRIQVR